MIIRHGHASDLPYLYDICHRTGYRGQDASEVVSDRLLLGHYFAAPYLVREPNWCWTATDEEGPVGYLVTTPDSRAFASWMNEDWLPAVRLLSPQRSNPEWSTFETWLRNYFHEPATFPEFVDQYPAHLHIDFLPRAQGRGLGTKVIGEFKAQLKERGIPGFHLGVGIENKKAQDFYAKQGFQVIRETLGVVFLGLKS